MLVLILTALFDILCDLTLLVGAVAFLDRDDNIRSALRVPVTCSKDKLFMSSDEAPKE